MNAHTDENTRTMSSIDPLTGRPVVRARASTTSAAQSPVLVNNNDKRDNMWPLAGGLARSSSRNNIAVAGNTATAPRAQQTPHQQPPPHQLNASVDSAMSARPSSPTSPPKTPESMFVYYC